MTPLEQDDPEVAGLIAAELERQRNTLDLIAAENFAPPAVLEAQGSTLTNKYAEGYPRHRYYGGCQWIDRVEAVAIERAKRLFGAEHANVQPHSGSQANMAVYFATLDVGDTILGLRLDAGGHLTHGARVNFSGRLYRAASYGVDPATEMIDYGAVRKVALETRPKLIIAGYSAYPRTVDFATFRAIADEVGALLLADIAHVAGMVVAGLYPDPVAVADFVTSTTHKTLRGPRGGLILCKQRYARAIDSAVFPGLQGGPLEHVIAAKAVCFRLAQGGAFRDYQRQLLANALALAEALLQRGFRLVSGGTDTHLVLVDLTNEGLTGKQAQDLLEEVGVVVNKNSIPFDPRPATVTSGIRLGTPAVTTRGMKEPEMATLAEIIGCVLRRPTDETTRRWAKRRVHGLCQAFPLYG